MQLQQAFDIPSSLERVWRSFKDIEGVVECLPGASLRAPTENGKLQLAMVVKLGPITANFVGDGEARFDDSSHSGTVEGAATDRKSASRMKGQVAFVVADAPGQSPAMTRVSLTIDYTMGGTLAQFSREGIVRELAQRLTDTFAANLRRKLEASEEAVTTVETGDARSAQPSSAIAGAMDTASVPVNVPSPAGATLAPQSSSSPTSLNFGSLLWAVIVDRVRRWFGRKPRS